MNLKTILAASASVVVLVGTTAGAYAANDIDALYAAAKAEGQLSVIALPDDWCGWRGGIDNFKAKYPGITVNELNPDAGSADEIEAIKANKDNKGPQAPDVIDVGLSYGPSATAEGLLMPYKVSVFDQMDTKDPDGHWYGGYYGVLSFIVNTDLVANVPTDWADLLKPEYKGQISLGGDPRTANQAIQGVWAAGLSATNGDRAGAADAGLDFMKKLNDAGNLVPVEVKSAGLAQGTTPVGIAWDYNELAWQKSLAGNPATQIVVPKTGVVGGYYAQAISAYAPHPNAAKLWMEYIYSDEGQIDLLRGFCHPARFNEMVSAGSVPKDLLDALPPAEGYKNAIFPSLDEQAAFKKKISTTWDSAVGVNVQ